MAKKNKKANGKNTVTILDKRIDKIERELDRNEPEMKYVDLAGDDVVIGVVGTNTLLNGIGQGASPQQRIGTKIRILKIRVRYQVQLNDLPVGGADSGSVSVFWENQSNGSAPTAYGVAPYSDSIAPFNYMSATNNSVMLPNGTLTDNENKYFSVLFRDPYALNQQFDGQNTYGPVREHDITVNRVVHYDNSNTGNITDIITNALYIGYAGNQLIGVGTSQSFLTWYVRVFYSDI